MFLEAPTLIGNVDLNLAINVLIVLLGTFLTASMAGRFLNTNYEKTANKFARKFGRKPLDKTKFLFVKRLLIASIYIIGFFFALFLIPSFRTLSASFIAGAGVLAIILGFAIQKPISNISSGILMALFEPFRIGDRIKIGDDYGDVEDINLRHTVINTWDNKRIVVPNSKMDDINIVNYTLGDEAVIRVVEVGISYDSDIDKARKIMIDAIKNHPEYGEQFSKPTYVTTNKEINVRVVELGEYSVKLKAYFWAKDQRTSFRILCDVLESVKKEFDKEGIEIPFPYRTLVYKKDLEEEKLKGKAAVNS